MKEKNNTRTYTTQEDADLSFSASVEAGDSDI